MLIPTVYYGRTGAGKSTKMKANVVAVRGCHLFVVPRKKSIVECEIDIKNLCHKSYKELSVLPFLRDDKKHYNMKIAQDITDRAARYDPANDHCCLIITQAAFQKLELHDFAGWHLKLDELLTNGNPSGSLYSPIMWTGLASLFTIEPLTERDLLLGIDKELFRIRAQANIEAKDVLADQRLSKEDQNLYQRATSPIATYTDATCIEDMARRRCWWGSPWTLDCVDNFASVEIAACDIEESLMHLLAPRPYAKVLCPTKVSSASIRIMFFDEGPATCSAAFWEEERGRRNLILIAQEIARRGGVDYWTCNESAESILKPILPKTPTTMTAREGEDLDEADGTWITQQQDGTNHYRRCTSCAILISSKAQDHEVIFEKLNPAASKAAISKGREGGLIFQFISRGAIRNEDFSGDYIVYVYDRQQAEALRDKLITYDFPHTQIEHIPLTGFENRVREPRGRKSEYATPGDRREAKRKQNCERQRRFRERKKQESSVPPTQSERPAVIQSVLPEPPAL